MSTNFNVADIAMNGAQLALFTDVSPYHAPPSGHSYIAIVDNYQSITAVEVRDRQEYEGHHQAYKQGQLRNLRLYQVATYKLGNFKATRPAVMSWSRNVAHAPGHT